MVRTEPNGSDTDDAQRRAQTVKQSKAGLQQTIADMKAMAADREEAGYETLTVAAGDTTPKTPDTGESDEWGLSYVVPSNVEDEFVALYDRASFDEIGVYQADAGGSDSSSPNISTTTSRSPCLSPARSGYSSPRRSPEPHSTADTCTRT